MKPWTEATNNNKYMKLTPDLHTNSHFKMWAEKWTIMQEAGGSSTAPNAASRISSNGPCHRKIDLQKIGPTYKGQVVNPRQQGPKTQSIHMPKTNGIPYEMSICQTFADLRWMADHKHEMLGFRIC